MASPPSLAPYLDIFVIQHSFTSSLKYLFKPPSRHSFNGSSRHIISRSPVICRLWYHVPGPRFTKSCSGWVAMKLTPYTGAGTLMSFFLCLFFYSLLSTKRPPMLWESTCRAVTSFRPYELVDRPGNAYICQPNAYAYRPPYGYTCRMRIPADRSIERRPTVHLHRTLAPYCYLSSPFCRILRHCL